jgi:asparagine synthase (glutamine-hydrolysing)
MCGFVVVLSANRQEPIELGLLSRMSELVAHRGRDDQGVFTEEGVAIAFRRLAIFDLAPSGHQPMFSADGRYVIVFNGAIYNFIELRSELQGLGHTFRSQSDTEVLLAAYVQWGRECLPRLNGMWSFVVYDRTTRRLFAARDRFGVKPLFWYHDARGLVLTSEIKALRDAGYAQLKPNWRTIARFLLEEQLHSDRHETFYASVNEVPAGSYFEGAAGAPPLWQRYWNLEEAAAALPRPTHPVQEFRQLFDDAVRLRMRSNVPVAVSLSGGLDSTSILCSMAEQSPAGSEPFGALCYRDPGFDETPLVEAVLRQTAASLWPLESNPAQFWNCLDRHLWHQDEPVHSFTSVVSFELMKVAHERGAKVVLNGQGADEVLAGYPSYFINHWTELVRSGQFLRAHREMSAQARSHGRGAFSYHARVARACLNQLRRHVPGHRHLAAGRRRARMAHDPWISPDVKARWEPADQPHFDSLHQALRFSVEHASLPLYLRVEDRNSMAHGVETRLPFLDHRLVSYVFRLDSQWKVREEYTKVVLREAMRDRIPEPVRTQVHKLGFPTSSDQWFRAELYVRCKDLLASRAVRESGVWNVSEVQRALEDHRRRVKNLGARLFDFVQFASWLALSKFSAIMFWLMPVLD